jgi:hypothetical protein
MPQDTDSDSCEANYDSNIDRIKSDDSLDQESDQDDDDN